MNPLAEQLNRTILDGNPLILEMLSETGRQFFFPKGILSQSAEAKEKAHFLNATIGIAKEAGRTMCFNSVASSIKDIPPRESLTYAPSFGIPALRKAWQESIYRKNPSLEGKNISLPVVTCGITHALSMFGDLWMDPGDVLVLPSMMWGNYNLILGLRRGVRMDHFELFDESGGFNTRSFSEAVNRAAAGAKKIGVLLNFPHNPSGYSPTTAEADEIARILKETAEGGTLVVAATDDSYFGLFFEEATCKESIFAKICGSHPRLMAIKLDGATKENYVWGLRVGFITYGTAIDGDAAAVYDALERKTAGCIRGNISNASHLGQSIVLRSMNSDRFGSEQKEKFDIMKRRARRVKEVLADGKYAAAWDVYPFNSGYFMCIRLKTVDAETLRVHLLDRYGVGLIALGERNIRVAFSCLEETDIPVLFDTVLQGVNDLEQAG